MPRNWLHPRCLRLTGATARGHSLRDAVVEKGRHLDVSLRRIDRHIDRLRSTISASFMKIFQTFSLRLMFLISTYIIRATALTTRTSVIENEIHETSSDKTVEICGNRCVAYHSPTDTLILAAIMKAARISKIMYLTFFMNLFSDNQFCTNPDAQHKSQNHKDD